MKKKFLSMVTALVMLISLLPQGILTVSAAITVTQPSTDENGVYQIGTAAELYWFAGLVNGTLEGVAQNLSANAVLTANIDLSGTGNWTPIGNAANKYRGTFDGQNHTVKDMSITKQGNNSGLFGYTDGATIKNIIITGEITITAESYTEGYGSIVGRADNNTTVTNCHSSVNITIDSTMESTAGNCIGHIGGIIGKMHDANSPISNCSYSGTIELKDKPINVAAGIVGYAIYSSVPITNCSFTGKINSTNTGATIIGGIFGYTRSQGDVKVTNCLSVGTITKSGDTSVTGILIGQINTGYGNNAVKNNYCISSSINVIGSTTGTPTTAPATLCTETQLTSGEVAYLLQSGQEADENGNTPEVWGQEIGIDNYPVPGGAKVYQVVAYAGCKGNPGNESTVYSNTDAPVYGDHSFDSNGFCEYGDSGYQPAEWDETNNRYEIGNAGQLYWFAGLVNGTLEGVTQNTSANAILTENIVVNTGVLKSDGTLADDTSGFTSWTPIGSYDYNYTGTFDGQGYTVSGLYFNNTNAYNVGLFGYVGSNETNKGSVSNVGVVDSYFGGHMEVGGVCGTAGDNSTITNCYNTGTVRGTIYVGGVCGTAGDNSTISNCYNTGTVIGKSNVGGVCGSAGGNSTIKNCYNTGLVDGNDNGGGVCGENYGTIEVCYNTGSVIGIGKTGGVCGTAGDNSTIANCYNAGSIASSLYAGGVCGSAGDNSTITNCYNAGSVAASGNSACAGGVCGRNSNGNITNCYFNSGKYSGNAVAPNGNGTVTNVEGKTTEEFASGEVAYLLQGKQTENVWGQEIGTDNYPVLISDIAKKVLKVEFKTLGADGEYTLYAERYGNYGKVLSDFPEEITDTIWVDGVNQFTASSTVTEDKTVYSVGYSVKYDDDGKVVISAPKMGNYTIIIASYSGKSLLKVQSADITLESWVDLYEITDLNGFDTTGADTVKVFFWDTEMRPQCDIAVKTLS